MTGYIWTHINVEDRRSCCSTGIRVDIAKKHALSYNIVGERLIIAALTCRASAARIDIAKINLPPQGSPFWSPLRAEEVLGMAARTNIMCGDMSWRPTTAGAVLWAPYERLPELPRGHAGWKAQASERDKHIDQMRPRNMAAIPPRMSAAWSARRAWGTGSTYTIDYFFISKGFKAQAYEVCKTPEAVSTNHSWMIMRGEERGRAAAAAQELERLARRGSSAGRLGQRSKRGDAEPRHRRREADHRVVGCGP